MQIKDKDDSPPPPPTPFNIFVVDHVFVTSARAYRFVS